MVPLLIKVQQLQRQLIDQPDDFGTAWNWVDAFVRIEYQDQPAVYRFLRQTLLSRRVLLLLDGLDEGGAKRSEIERHVTEVLAPQGLVMLCTSRPAGITETQFSGFRRLHLSPLTEAQQTQALEQRLGADKVGPLLEYLETVPVGADGQRVTSNPLMLSMFASVYELRQGVGMPETVAELYKHASEAMLARGGASSRELRRLMQAIFFEAHSAGQREIEDRLLDAAALSLELPEAMEEIRRSNAYQLGTKPSSLLSHLDREDIWTTQNEGSWSLPDFAGGNPKHGSWPQNPQHRLVPKGTEAQTCVIELRCSEKIPIGFLVFRSTDSDVGGRKVSACKLTGRDVVAKSKWKVTTSTSITTAIPPLADGQGYTILPCTFEPGSLGSFELSVFSSEPFTLEPLQKPAASAPPSSVSAIRVHQGPLNPPERLAIKLRDARDQLPPAMRLALEQVRLRVARDELPLFTLLQMEPLRLQSSHLSFQEYFAARALCEEGTRLSGPPPWEWSAWWANVARLGNEMGGSFGKGLLRGAGVEGDVLDLSAKLSGDSKTGAAVLAAVVRSDALTSLNVSNNLGAVAASIMAGQLGLAELLKTNTVLTQLNLGGNNLGSESGKLLAQALTTNTTLSHLTLDGGELPIRKLRGEQAAEAMDLSNLELCDASGIVIGHLLKSNTVTAQLNLGGNLLGIDSANALIEALQVNTTLTSIVFGGAVLPIWQLRGAEALTAVDLSNENLADAAAVLIAHLLKSNTVIKQLIVGDISLTAHRVIVEALQVDACPTSISLGSAAFPTSLRIGAEVATASDLVKKLLGEASGVTIAHLASETTELLVQLDGKQLDNTRGWAMVEALQTNDVINNPLDPISQQCMLDMKLPRSLPPIDVPLHRHARRERGGIPEYQGKRITVSDEQVPWSCTWPAYNPREFTAPVVINNSALLLTGHKWADPAELQGPAVKKGFKSLLAEVRERTTYVGGPRGEKLAAAISFDAAGVPLNPRGRTGLRGRGLLGKWGPNHAADPIVTRYQGTQLQMVAIKRKDTGDWAIPGGMVDDGEMVGVTLRREFTEEAGGHIEQRSKAKFEKLTTELFKKGDLVYSGCE